MPVLIIMPKEAGIQLFWMAIPGILNAGGGIIDVKGEKPADVSIVTDAINKAYEKKYAVKNHNKKWVNGLIQPERVARTIEFIPL